MRASANFVVRQYLRRRLVCILDQLDSEMQGRAIVMGSRRHNLQLPARDHRFSHAMLDCRSRYTNLCAFASDLIREKIDLFAWEDIMATAFNRARQNLPPRMSTQGTGSRMGNWEAYLSGAEAWANYDFIQKSLSNQRISREAWHMWQDMFTQANGGSTRRASRTARNSSFLALSEIERALRDHNDPNQARSTRGSYRPRPRPLRIPGGT